MSPQAEPGTPQVPPDGARKLLPEMGADGTHERAARDAGVLVLGRMLAIAAEALSPFIIVRLLSKADMGAFGGVMLLYTSLSVFLTAGFPAGMLYFLADRSSGQRAAIAWRMLRALWVLGLGISVLLIGVGRFGNGVLEFTSSWLTGAGSVPSIDLSPMVWFCLYPPLDVVARVFPNLCVAEGRPRSAAAFGVLRAIGMAMGTLIPASLGFGVRGIVLGLSAFALLQVIGCVVWVRSTFKGVQVEPSPVTVGDMVRFAIPVALTDIVNNLNAAVDRYTILLLMSAAAFAEYAVGAWQLPITSIAYTVGHVYMPSFVRHLRAGDGVAVIEAWRRAAGKVALIVAPVCVVFLVAAEEFVEVAFTDEYLSTTPIFMCYVGCTMLRIAPFGALLLAANRGRDLFKSAGASLLTNVLLTVPLTLWLGFVGPALGTLIAAVVSAAIYCFYIARALGVSWWRTYPVGRWLQVALLALLAGVPALAVKHWWQLTPLIQLLLTAVTVVPLFVIGGRATGVMAREDLNFAQDWLALKVLKRRTT